MRMEYLKEVPHATLLSKKVPHITLLMFQALIEGACDAFFYVFMHGSHFSILIRSF